MLVRDVLFVLRVLQAVHLGLTAAVALLCVCVCVSQVASRVQKYFIKLTKAGIPVPGRTPNLCMYSKKVRQFASVVRYQLAVHF